jgi:hypothetical protein
VVDRWVREWSAPTEVYELEGGAGAAYTVAEKAATTKAGRLLTSTDPGPQLVHRVAAKPGSPLLVRFEIRVVRPAGGDTQKSAID